MTGEDTDGGGQDSGDQMHMVVLLEPCDLLDFLILLMMDQIKVSVFSTDHDTHRLSS